MYIVSGIFAIRQIANFLRVFSGSSAQKADNSRLLPIYIHYIGNNFFAARESFHIKGFQRFKKYGCVKRLNWRHLRDIY